MPVEVVWDDTEQTIIRQIYSGNVVSEDYCAATDQVVDMVQSVGYLVHSIHDSRGVHVDHANMFAALAYANRKLRPVTIGVRVVVQPRALSLAVISIAHRIAPHVVANLETVQTLAEAYRVIGERRSDGKVSTGISTNEAATG